MDYKEMNAIGIVRLMLTDGVITEEQAAKYFPELAESEDEKIRKELIDFFSASHATDTFRGISWDKVVAWLEKQGQVKDSVISQHENKTCKENDDSLTSEDERIKEEIKVILANTDLSQFALDYTFADMLMYLEKQGEQKPKFRVGDTIKCKHDDRQFTIKSVDLDKRTYTYTQEGCGNDIDYADEMFELVEQKPAWSEEVQEEQVNEEFINALGTMLNDGLPDRYLVSEERIKKSAELLFSIARKQLKNEMQGWSEEDEFILKDAITAVDLMLNSKFQESNPNLYKAFEVAKHWLKSLKDRYSWKPSEDEIKALAEALSLANNCGEENAFDLRTLYEQLKKL